VIWQSVFVDVSFLFIVSSYASPDGTELKFMDMIPLVCHYKNKEKLNKAVCLATMLKIACNFFPTILAVYKHRNNLFTSI
jgi:hypothetical protein